ncbi:zinc-ribbon domain-containing protein [Myxococcota bacterium]|nr:zinc-ribbon domain-containing protein [Myxococcota bacterium]MBU1380782.1 zinc-ribbon domain-containing protein [Myxococcota bacterium]MBU1498916.1 zinc-ribbon domain-containing protein [Myxococcota bacterium]
MNFVCDKCTTRYSIPDEKVAGKILKLRCKKCGNTIILKDPKADPEEKQHTGTDEGRVLLQNAFKQSLSQKVSTSERKMISPEPERSSGDKTQLVKIPGFQEQVPDEEWYLSDSRGQVGPMPFNELVARIKRGEPDPDAVVWRDGFRDWLTIDMVPELRSYYKHVPPPRRPTREVARAEAPPQQSSSQIVAQPPVTAPQPAAVQAPSINVASSREFNQQSAPAQIIIPAEALSPFKGKTIPIVVISAIAVIAAFFLGAKFMGGGKSSDKPAPVQKENNQVVVKDKVKENIPVSDMTPQMSEVVYIVANDTDKDKDKTPEDSDMNESPMGKRNNGKKKIPDIMVPDIDPSKLEINETPKPAVSRGTGGLNQFMTLNQSQITRCYARAVRMGQKELVDQSIKIHIRVNAAGKLSSISFTGKMPPVMKNCMISTITGFKFPKGNQTDSLTYTIHFN